MENSIKAIENCVNKAISDYEEVYFKKDNFGKPNISQEDMNDSRLINRLCSKFKTILTHIEQLKKDIKELKLQLDKKDETINDLINKAIRDGTTI